MPFCGSTGANYPEEFRNCAGGRPRMAPEGLPLQRRGAPSCRRLRLLACSSPAVRPHLALHPIVRPCPACRHQHRRGAAQPRAPNSAHARPATPRRPAGQTAAARGADPPAAPAAPAARPAAAPAQPRVQRPDGRRLLRHQAHRRLLPQRGLLLHLLLPLRQRRAAAHLGHLPLPAALQRRAPGLRAARHLPVRVRRRRVCAGVGRSIDGRQHAPGESGRHRCRAGSYRTSTTLLLHLAVSSC